MSYSLQAYYFNLYFISLYYNKIIFKIRFPQDCFPSERMKRAENVKTVINVNYIDIKLYWVFNLVSSVVAGLYSIKFP